MCPVQYRGTTRAFMDWDVYTGLVDQLASAGELHLQGLGEPLLHPKFFPMARYAADRGMHVTVTSNLSVLTERHAEQFATCGVRTVYVSVDGASAGTYERIRVGARFDRLERNVARLRAVAERCGTPEIVLTAVVMRENLDEIADIVRLAARWGLPQLGVQHLCHDFGESTLPARYAPMRAFVENQTLIDFDPQRVADAFARARGAAAENGVTLRLPPISPREHAPGTPGRSRCDWPWHGPYITYDGTAMPCCIAATPDRSSLGDLARDGVEAVWNGPGYAAFRKRLDSDDPPEICRTCSVYRHVF